MKGNIINERTIWAINPEPCPKITDGLKIVKPSLLERTTFSPCHLE
ncbi:hypothetical protein ACFLU8_02545 [Chloroflexota bacterium]